MDEVESMKFINFVPGDKVDILIGGEWEGPYTVTDKVGRTPEHLVLQGTYCQFEHYNDSPYNTQRSIVE